MTTSLRRLRVNNRIRARDVMVIGPDGHPKGVMSIQDAMRAARQAGMDLVEVSPKSQPPVCKILDFGKFRYEVSKRDKESRKHHVTSKLKELKFHINTDEHDYLVKLRHAEEFLFKGMKVKIVMVFRGRDMQNKDIGEKILRKIVDDLAQVGLPDAEPKLLGRNFSVMMIPLAERKRRRKFTEDHRLGEAPGTNSRLPEAGKTGLAKDELNV